MGHKTLIVYYSRTGTTRKVAETVAAALHADIEEIVDLTDRSGPIGYIKAGRDASLKKLTRIRRIEKKPSDYDLIIFGTPVWAFTMVPALRSYLEQNRPFLKDKEFAFFCTQGGSGDKKTFEDISMMLDAKPITTLTLKTIDVKKENYHHELTQFVTDIESHIKAHIKSGQDTFASLALSDDARSHSPDANKHPGHEKKGHEHIVRH